MPAASTVVHCPPMALYVHVCARLCVFVCACTLMCMCEYVYVHLRKKEYIVVYLHYLYTHNSPEYMWPCGSLHVCVFVCLAFTNNTDSGLVTWVERNTKFGWEGYSSLHHCDRSHIVRDRRRKEWTNGKTEWWRRDEGQGRGRERQDRTSRKEKRGL